MFVIDFDNTLMDTEQFKLDRLKGLKKVGVSEDLYWQSYKEAREDSHGFATYSDELHAKMLAQHGFAEKKIFRALQESTADLKEYLFPDTHSFLSQLKEYGEPMVLLSLGVSAFQEYKIKRCEIKHFFDRVFLVDESKIHILEELFTKEDKSKAWFVNDRVGQTVEVVKHFPGLKIVMKQSSQFSEDEYKASGLPYFKTLTEIADYVRKNS